MVDNNETVGGNVGGVESSPASVKERAEAKEREIEELESLIQKRKDLAKLRQESEGTVKGAVEEDVKPAVEGGGCLC